MIEIQHLNKTFTQKSAKVEALQDVSLTIPDGSIYGVIGYSGAGKSTLVRCLNLLERPDSGKIRIDGFGEITMIHGRPYMSYSAAGPDTAVTEAARPEDAAASAASAEQSAELSEPTGLKDPVENPLPADAPRLRRMTARQENSLRRGIGMIFQHFNLLDRATVFDNIAYPLRFTGRTSAQIRRRVCDLLEMVNLSDKIDAYPSQLSGGQKQRVAIARALADDPRILLSDEATSALDPDATESILNLLKDVNKKLGITIVLITHEMAVIKAIAERVAVMENGRVVEEGTVYDIFANPQAEITRKFVASSSLLGKLEKMLDEDAGLLRVKPGEMLVRMIFDKEYVGEAVITTAARKFGFDLNLILANAEYLHGSPIGGIVGILRGDPEKIREGIAYMTENHVRTEVLRDGSEPDLQAECLDR